MNLTEGESKDPGEQRRSTAFKWASAAIMLAWFVPWAPTVPYAGLDPSWRLALSVACEHGLSFGRDITFTFGPLGCLSTWQYWPSTYVPSLVLWSGMAIALSMMVSNLPGSLLRRGTALAAIAWLGLAPDTALLALPLLYVIYTYYVARPSLTSVGCAALLAPLALVKFTLLPIAGLAVLAGFVNQSGSLRQRLLGPALFMAAGLLAWVGFRQPLGAIPAFITTSMEVAGGYSEAMAGALGSPLWPTSVTLVLVLMIGAWGDSIWRDEASTLRRVTTISFLLAAGLVSWLHATTRGDSAHLILGSTIAGAGLLLHLASPSKSARWPASVVLLSLVLSIKFGIGGNENLPGRSFGGRVSASVGALPFVSGAKASLDESLQSFASGLMSDLEGRANLDQSFDILGHDQFLLTALPHENWRPRPVFQSYSAYTPKLAWLNAAYLGSADAPETLFWRLGSIDGRLPSMDDAAAWSTIRSHYAVAGESPTGHILLERRAQPVSVSHQESEKTLLVDDWTTLPDWLGQSIFATGYTREGGPSISSRLRGDPGYLVLDVRIRSGHVRSFRFLLGAGETGFLLSPLVLNNQGLMAWLESRTSPRDEVREIRLTHPSGMPVPVSFTLRTGSPPEPAGKPSNPPGE